MTRSRDVVAAATASVLALVAVPAGAAGSDPLDRLDDVPREYLDEPAAHGFVRELEPTVRGLDADTGTVAGDVATVTGVVEQVTGEGDLIVADDGEELTFGADVFFAFDEAVLTPTARETLDDLAGDIEERADASGAMQVVGHTDSVGEPDYNQTLSEQRAQAVADYLVGELGLGDVDLTVAGRGEAEPVAPNETADGEDNPEGRARNRRVELTFER